ncbi:Dabb family protein [Arthrobacter sp. 2MCAF15]|uniref:Dabb family protein n=1 Tax=Arthrobacter sp. 2MCAF15 TaxID=3232984 RepID=UPI003F918765
MIRHTVVFSLVHPEGSAMEADFLATAQSTLTAIPDVMGFAISRQVSPKSPLRFQFAMTFPDRAAYAAYDSHPAHVAFVQTRWVPEVSDFQEYDFIARA